MTRPPPADGNRWSSLLGYVFFVGMLATGYYYNVTFVQLGLVHLGTEQIGMVDATVALNMATLALFTATVAISFGVMMVRRRWSQNFVAKLRITFFVIALQTLLTSFAPGIRSPELYFLWIVMASIALGVGVPATFGMTVDLVPVRHRGTVAALITALAYFAASAMAETWTIEAFARQMAPLMVVGTVALGIVSFRPFTVVDDLARQHLRPEFARGRFVHVDGSARIRRARFLLPLLFMFGIYFVDSLGFLRIIETPTFVGSAWHSPDDAVRLFIGATHVVSALIAGVLYTAFDEQTLLLWIFGIFALVQMMYVMQVWIPGAETVPLALPMLYATAVSIYTVVNFALWADLSTPTTIARNAAVGVAVSGWVATFLSTALSIEWQSAGIALDTHLNRVAAVAIVFFVAVMAMVLLTRPNQGARS
jgi:MFS family permease